MSTHTSKINRKTERHTGASFFHKSAALGLTACVLGGSLLAAPAAQAADIGWTPSPTKAVVGSPGEKGPNGHDIIDNLGVWPGEKVEYNIGVDLNVGPGGQQVTSLQVIDKLPAGFEVDQASIRVVGDNTLTLASSRDYKVVLKDGVLTLGFSDEWVAAHVGADSDVPLTKLGVSFTVTVSKDAKPYSSQDNVVTQVVNGESFTSPAASVLVPGVDPLETVTGSDRQPVGSRVAVGGDKLNYSVKLDGTFGADTEGRESTPLELAYDVDRFGIIDDFDEESVDISARDVRVLDSKGADRSDLFTITSKAGVLNVLAKTSGDRGSVPASVLDEDFRVEYTAYVRNVAKDTNIVGSTVEVVDDRVHPVAAETSVKVQAVAPHKSAVTPAGEETPETALKNVVQNAEFTYKLGSSAIPANRLVPLESWTMVDGYTAGDRALHDTWSVVADTDIRGTDGKVLIAKGSVIADQGNTKYFTASFDSDSVSMKATKAFLEAVNDDVASELAWSAYVQAVRTAEVGTRVANTSHEWSNGFDRSATVTTGTEAPAGSEEPVTPAPVDPTTPAEPEPTTPATPEPTKPATPEPTTPAEPEPTTPATPEPTKPATPEPTTPAKPEPTQEPTTEPTKPATPEPTTPAKPEPTTEPTKPATPEPTTPAKPEPTTDPTEPATPAPSDPAGKRSISVESFVTSEGQEKGDRDSIKDPYAIAAPETPVKVTYKITNTGETALDNVQLVIATQDNSSGALGETSGALGDLSCESGEGETASKALDTLAAGETASCEGVVTGVKPGTVYADIATVTAVEATDAAGTPEKAVALEEDSSKDAEPATVTDTDTLHASLAAAKVAPEVKDGAPVADNPAAGNTAGDQSAGDNKRGAVTGEAVSSTNPVLMGGGIASIFAAMMAGVLLLVRRNRSSRSETE